MKYLYGASVQGIQQFIFETNKLREIAGASELIEQICTHLFKEIAPGFQDTNLIIGAAGNIKYVFENKTDCQYLIREFPKKVMSVAPGITISQAVVEYQGNLEKEHINVLESRLRIQRNKPIVQHGLGLMISERSRRTGKSGVKWKKIALDNKVVIDLAQKNKTESSEGSKDSLLEKILGKGHTLKERNYPYDIGDIVGKKEGEWIAVVHADGNNLGKIIMKMADELSKEHTQSAFKEFSKRLEIATVNAASSAFYEVINDKVSEKGCLPLRPVILGGDDLTVIIRGDIALDYTNSFLKFFEKHTSEEFQDFGVTYGLQHFNGSMTACAGIAYIKPNYPFHYGVKLSEELCKYSKTVAKNIDSDKTPSCISFHRVQSSFIDDYKDIVEQELTAKKANVKFNFGPYFLKPQKGFATVGKLKEWTKEIKREDAPKGPLRNWIGELQVSSERAAQHFQRIKNLNGKFVSRLSLDKEFTERSSQDKTQTYTHIFDVLTLAAIEKK